MIDNCYYQANQWIILTFAKDCDLTFLVSVPEWETP